MRWAIPRWKQTRPIHVRHGTLAFRLRNEGQQSQRVLPRNRLVGADIQHAQRLIALPIHKVLVFLTFTGIQKIRLHLIRPLCRMDYERAHRFRPEVRVLPHDLRSHARTQRRGCTCGISGG